MGSIVIAICISNHGNLTVDMVVAAMFLSVSVPTDKTGRVFVVDRANLVTSLCFSTKSKNPVNTHLSPNLQH